LIKVWTYVFCLRFFRQRSINAHVTAFSSKPIVICM